ncbi:MAG: hypothetical protein JW994_03215 [Candidatus Omnitrophica bacterium]|nr:hypothetical protein [Candidatus Omnitrophota bacterium]
MKPVRIIGMVAALSFWPLFMFFLSGCSQERSAASGSGRADLEQLQNEMGKIKSEQTALKVKLASLEKIVRSETETPEKEKQDLGFMLESINPENVDNRAVWGKTNKSDLYIVTTHLEKTPLPNSVIIWTGLGILPYEAYRIEGNSVSIIIRQSKETFVSSNNYINIRYASKP